MGAAPFWLLATASLLVAAVSARSGPSERTSAGGLSSCVDEATAALGRCCSQLRGRARHRPDQHRSASLLCATSRQSARARAAVPRARNRRRRRPRFEGDEVNALPSTPSA
ncbi:hypothetical protein BDA96_01G133800 [Sorghum bicolor]|uniref:Bifunctional inhibitor/plant lipid transfer protein/seed storage helical domain-containing protein n=1 Tax=Sorghum bicolor TaxID=4558 RepID=A0A921RYJ0_SORBI|nr:hypothetical protein BDA96_01G133800 [Sorghum bicolor]